MTQDAQIVAAKAAALLGERIAQLRQPGWQPLAHQVPPSGDWRGWAMIAGRMAGKTDACAHFIAEHVKGPPCLPGPVPHWIGIIAPTLGDAATSCFSGPSGLRVHSPDARMVQRPGGLAVIWPNGSEAKLFGAHTPEDVERLRSGGNRCSVWMEELAAWRYLDAAWAHMRFGLRVGPHPRWVASTTPKPRPLIKRLVTGDITGAILTKASYLDNPYIPDDVKQALEEEYGGTQLGRQELYGELVEQDENALWTRPMIDASRLKEIDRSKLARVTVGVDPSGGAGEQGIVVGGRMMLPRSAEDRRLLVHGFVLADRTVKLSPSQWGRRAVQAAVDFEANDIAVEINYGGDMAVSTIRSAADDMGIPIPIRKVQATRGKRVRAEPVAALTEQGRWHHVGNFPELEMQMTTWYPELDWSPDRLDGSVWTAWHNKVVRLPAGIAGQGLGSVMGRQIG
jgi:phage terminase large subunit-like protein